MSETAEEAIQVSPTGDSEIDLTIQSLLQIGPPFPWFGVGGGAVFGSRFSVTYHDVL